MTIWHGMALAITNRRSGLLARTNRRELVVGQLNDLVTLTMRASLVQLLIVNLLLQLVDGLASYHIISAGVPEENPLVATFITNWGVMGGLLYSKFLGCALVILIFLLRHKVGIVATQGLTILAYVYSCLGIFLMIKMLVLFT
jgi:hypothetical protein